MPLREVNILPITSTGLRLTRRITADDVLDNIYTKLISGIHLGTLHHGSSIDTLAWTAISGVGNIPVLHVKLNYRKSDICTYKIGGYTGTSRR